MTESKVLDRLAAGEALHLPDQYYLHIIRKDEDGFLVEEWAASGGKKTQRCESLAEALLWVIGDENIVWRE